MKYKLHYEFRSRFSIDVEAASREEAEELGDQEVDNHIQNNLTAYSLDIDEEDAE